MMPSLIKASFEKTEIYPINCNIFTKEDFAPSKTSSTIAWTSSSFPADVQSSDPVIPSDAKTESDESNDEGLGWVTIANADFADDSEDDDPDYEITTNMTLTSASMPGPSIGLSMATTDPSKDDSISQSPSHEPCYCTCCTCSSSPSSAFIDADDLIRHIYHDMSLMQNHHDD